MLRSVFRSGRSASRSYGTAEHREGSGARAALPQRRRCRPLSAGPASAAGPAAAEQLFPASRLAPPPLLPCRTRQARRGLPARCRRGAGLPAPTCGQRRRLEAAGPPGMRAGSPGGRSGASGGSGERRRETSATATFAGGCRGGRCAGCPRRRQQHAPRGRQR